MVKTTLGLSRNTAIAAGVAATAAAAVGAYWLYGSKGASKNRKTARSWMLKARAEVMDAVDKTVKKAGEIDKDTYMDIVKGIASRYGKLSTVTRSEVGQLMADAQEAWKYMIKSNKSTTARSRTASKRTRRPTPRMA